jgi:crotonobetainyl-CoA:carnitine CoA-transferase CaiB-like acyl-CoA transferase
MADGLFGDLLVIDCGSYVAAPAAATIMSDFGARVIKIEPPGAGDPYRSLIRLGGDDDVMDYYWLLDSRNKESVALDLKNPAERAALDRLIERADVFVTNYPFAVRERLRLRAEDVRKLNKRLIYASMTPFGEHGPQRGLSAFDMTAWWARSGLMDFVRPSPDAELAPAAPAMGDHPTAVALYAAILTGLYRRQITDEGCEVSTSLLANGLWSNAALLQAALCDIEIEPRPERGKRNPLIEFYRTSDRRDLALAIINSGREWPALARAVGREDWLQDARFCTRAARAANGQLLTQLLTDAFAAETWSHWKTTLADAGVTHSLVARTGDHLSDPQIEANGLLPEFVDGFGLKTLDSPFQVGGETKQPPRLAPSLGQHTREVLQEFGCLSPDVATGTD